MVFSNYLICMRLSIYMLHSHEISTTTMAKQEAIKCIHRCFAAFFFLLIYHASELGINENLLTNGEKQKIIQSVTRLNCNKAQAMAMLQTEIQLTYSKWEEWRSREWGGMNERAEKKCVRPRAYLLWYTTPNNSSFLKVPSVKWPSMTPK